MSSKSSISVPIKTKILKAETMHFCIYDPLLVQFPPFTLRGPAIGSHRESVLNFMGTENTVFDKTE